jgi:hypothetical protein
MALVGKSSAGNLQTLALFSPNFSTERVIRRLLLVLGGQGTVALRYGRHPTND